MERTQTTERKTMKQWREERGISQMEVARRTGASLAAIQGVESGRNEPRIGMAIRIAEALGVTLDQVEWPLGNPKVRAKRRKADGGD
jgi:transcriptional regulator with XRE-family HTH domain